MSNECVCVGGTTSPTQFFFVRFSETGWFSSSVTKAGAALGMIRDDSGDGEGMTVRYSQSFISHHYK